MGRDKTHGRPPADDYLRNLRNMELLQVIHLSEGNGYPCEEMPLCTKPAAKFLQFKHEKVNLCADAYKRYRGKL